MSDKKWLAIGAGAVGLVALVIGAWFLVGWVLDGGLDRAWAVIATLLLPAVAFGFYRLGQIEARGAITGLKMGVAEVHTAAEKAGGIKVTLHQRMREADKPPVVVLPDPGAGFSMRQLSDGERVDL